MPQVENSGENATNTIGDIYNAASGKLDGHIITNPSISFGLCAQNIGPMPDTYGSKISCHFSQIANSDGIRECKNLPFSQQNDFHSSKPS
mmetsp:Transcript_31113/g.46018  ORF Transcript_31113/g.46018 Transcript_31113/m.46018 type:complete len:90 (-) Transcript_31113:137-406(-)